LRFGILRARIGWIAALVLLASGALAAAHENPGRTSSRSRLTSTSDSESSSKVTSRTFAKTDYDQEQASRQQAVIDRIIFLGNRRIRSDTLKARIFTREGDPYNEDTLRRDFQALWNTQFFEDVKLRVEDSPDGPNHKNIIFEVKERPVIRRIRYDGIHSVSESDILDRFKERKVGLTVESQFDPTRIKKAEVVLK